MIEPRRPDADPFEILGLQPEADDRAVRKAFASALREARSSGDSARVELVQNAFEAIRDEESRARLRRVAGKEQMIGALFAKSQQALEANDLAGAVACMQRLLHLAPDLEPALERWARIELGAGRLSRAQKLARRLVKVAPRRGDARELLSRVLVEQARAEGTDAIRRQSHLETALLAARQARELGLDTPDLYILESDIYLGLGREAAARRVLKRALDGAVEIRTRELELIMARLRLEVAAESLRGVEETLSQLALALPESGERTKSIGYELCDLAVDMAPHNLVAAGKIAEFAETCCPDDPRVEELVKAFGTAHEEMYRSEPDDAREAIALAEAQRRTSLTSSSIFENWWIYVIVFVVIKLIILFVRTANR